MNILRSIWFSPWTGDLQTIGIVKCQDKVTDEVKLYIGTGQGLNQFEDEMLIVKRGAPLYPELLKKFLEVK
ncbi:hypothetical protein [uncultured Peptoniphilus sp.]|uniref:hypothetical protein n=1 Tax=uncultured Peptoniphilus sp. TaxID=254354 RepID=UPI0028054C81|nr:hypothetical protein [uncultured Peptoniphilus sp.]